MPKRMFVARFDSLPFKHWILYIQHSKEEFELFEMEGEVYRFTYHTSRNAPSPKQRIDYYDRIPVGNISSGDLDDVRVWAESQEIRKHWNWHCQNWVCNFVEQLMKAGVLPHDKDVLERLHDSRENLDDSFDPDRPRVLDPEHEVESVSSSRKT